MEPGEWTRRGERRRGGADAEWLAASHGLRERRRCAQRSESGPGSESDPTALRREQAETDVGALRVLPVAMTQRARQRSRLGEGGDEREREGGSPVASEFLPRWLFARSGLAGRAGERESRAACLAAREERAAAAGGPSARCGAFGWRAAACRDPRHGFPDACGMAAALAPDLVSLCFEGRVGPARVRGDPRGPECPMRLTPHQGL